MRFVNVRSFITFDAALSKILKLSASTVVALLAAANCFVPSVVSVSSPVFVPEFVPVISEVIATVPFLSGRVHVLAAVIVFVNNPVNVFPTFRSQNLPSRNVFNHTQNVDILSTVGTSFPSTARTPAALLESVVSDACPRSIVSAAHACDMDPARVANVAIPQSYTDFTEGYFVLLA